MQLRICIVTGIFPPDIGGPATYVPRMALALTERGHQVTVVTLSEHRHHSDSSYPFRLIRLPRRSSKPWRWCRTVATIVQLGRQADVLFVNGLALEATLANLLLGRPMIQKIVGDLAWERAGQRGWVSDSFEEFQKRRYGLKVEALKALRAWWTRRATKVIVPSHYLARWVAQWGVPNESLVVIHNAVEPADDIRPMTVPLHTPFKVVTVGRLVPWKRVDKVIEAVRFCANAGLVIVGDGSQRQSLEALVRDLGLSERVFFAGQRSHTETLGLMAACDLFVLNSTYEGFPHVVLEAMSVGLPVVAANAGGTPEVVQDGITGLLVESTPGALAQAVQQLLMQPDLRRRLATAGQADAQQRFSFAAMVAQTEAILIHVGNPHAQPTPPLAQRHRRAPEGTA